MLLAATALALMTTAANAADARPKLYASMVNYMQRLNGRSYSNCDYTSRTCRRGIVRDSWNVFEQIDDNDRTTVLGHYACRDAGPVGFGSTAPGSKTPFYVARYSVCFDFDNGVVKQIGDNGDLFEMPIPGEVSGDNDQIMITNMYILPSRYVDKSK
jgi:hypothetical protein